VSAANVSGCLALLLLSLPFVGAGGASLLSGNCAAAKAAAGEALVEAAFAEVRAALDAAKSAPRSERKKALKRVRLVSRVFIEGHASEASADQLSTAGHYWLQLAEEAGDPLALAAGLAALRQASLPPSLEGAVGFQEARLRTRPGEVAPAWQAQTLSGSVGSAERRGWVLLSFWASWNPHCKDLLKQRLAPLVRRAPSLTLIHLGVGGNGEDLKKQVAYLDSIGCGGVRAFDRDGSCAKSFGVDGVPFLCLIGADGRVVARGPGLATIAVIERAIRRLSTR
jgi:hypothetical protein